MAFQHEAIRRLALGIPALWRAPSMELDEFVSRPDLESDGAMHAQVEQEWGAQA